MPGNRNTSINNTSPTPGASDESAPLTTSASNAPYPGRPVKMRRNLLGPSDPSVARAASTQIAAEGRIQNFARTATSQSISDSGPVQAADEEPMSTAAEPNLEPIAASSEESLQHGAGSRHVSDPQLQHSELEEVDSNPQISPMVTDMPEEGISRAAEVDMDDYQATMPAPDVQVLRPPSPASGTQAPNPTPTAMPRTSSVLIPSVPYSSPPISNLSMNNVSLPETSQGLPTGTTGAVETVAPPNMPISSIAELPQVCTDPSLSDLPAGRLTRRRRILRRIRTILMRRRILALLLGREVGDTAHAQLSQVQGISNKVPKAASI